MKQSDVNQLIDALKPIFATKDDFKKFETKQDDMDIKLDAFLGQILHAREAQELQQGTITEHSDE